MFIKIHSVGVIVFIRSYFSHSIPYESHVLASDGWLCVCVSGGPRDVSYVTRSKQIPAGTTTAAVQSAMSLPMANLGPSVLFLPALLGITVPAGSMKVAPFLAGIAGVNSVPACRGSSSLPTTFFEMCPGLTV